MAGKKNERLSPGCSLGHQGVFERQPRIEENEQEWL
jgi:hypothetical protein